MKSNIEYFDDIDELLADAFAVQKSVVLWHGRHIVIPWCELKGSEKPHIDAPNGELEDDERMEYIDVAAKQTLVVMNQKAFEVQPELKEDKMNLFLTDELLLESMPERLADMISNEVFAFLEMVRKDFLDEEEKP